MPFAFSENRLYPAVCSDLPQNTFLLPPHPKLTGANRQLVALFTLCGPYGVRMLRKSEAVRVLLALGLLDINIFELTKDLEVAEDQAEKCHKAEL